MMEILNPLDKLVRWGAPFHGLLSAARTSIKMGEHEHAFGFGSIFPAELTNRWDALFNTSLLSGGGLYSVDSYVHLVKVPGVPPLDLTPEQLAAEQALGRNWLSHGLLAGPYQGLFSYALNGWVCIDGTGARWYIKPVGSPALHMGTLQPADSL